MVHAIAPWIFVFGEINVFPIFVAMGEDPIDIPLHEVEFQELDNPLRAVIVINSPDVPEGEMDERLLDEIQTFDEVNGFFDKFDEEVALKNEDHIKYEVGSDGLVVIIVDSKELKQKVLTFIDEYTSEVDNRTEDAEDRPAKKARK